MVFAKIFKQKWIKKLIVEIAFPLPILLILEFPIVINAKIF